MRSLHLKIIMATAVLLSLIPAGGYAAEPVAVIVNKDNPIGSLSVGDVRKIYTNNTLSWPDGAAINIYDLAIQDPVRYEFSEKILGRSPNQVAEDWAHLKITNQAKNPPLTMKSEALIIRRVSRERGAIGYVSLNAVRNNQDVKVVNRLQ